MLGVLAATGCRSIGPGTVPRDRFDYSRAIGDSWKHQTLLNIVKLRYLDLPIFLDVAQVVSGYSLETGINVGGQVSSAGAVQGNNLLLGAEGRFTDRPTITYMPLTGERFLEGFMKPLDPASVFYMVQTGYAADWILELTVESLNGLRNRPTRLDVPRQADPGFWRALELLREIQDAGGVGMRVEQDTTGKQTTVLFFRSEERDAGLQERIAEFRRLLGLPGDSQQFRLVYSSMRGGPAELAVATRSLVQVLMALAAGIEVPERHRERRLVPPLTEAGGPQSGLFKVRSGKAKPDDCFVAVPYEGMWFWVANDDWRSKRTLSFIMFLFTLANTGEAERLPLVTIPAQ